MALGNRNGHTLCNAGNRSSQLATNDRMPGWNQDRPAKGNAAGMSESKLDELAWRCLTKPDAVKVEDLGLTQGDIATSCEFRQERLFFRDVAEAKARAIRHIQRAVITPAAATPAILFKAVERCWLDAGQARHENLGGCALSELHNKGEIDAVHIAIEAVRSGSDVFTVSRVMTDSLPRFDEVDIPNLLTLFGLMHPKVKNDLSQGFIYGAVGEWMKRHPVRIDEVVAACLAIPQESSAPLLRMALAQGVASEWSRWLARIHELIDDTSPVIALSAIEALGLVDWGNAGANDTAKAAAVIRAGLRSDDESVLVSSACSGLNLINTAHDQHTLIDEIVALDRHYIAHLVGDHLAFRGEHLNAQPWYQDKIMLLASKAGQNKGGYRGVDHILSCLFNSQGWATCMEWLHTWVVANASAPHEFPEEFPQLFQLISENREERGVLLAEWLKHDEIGVQKVARQVLNNAGLEEGDAPRFPASVLDEMTQPSLLHLIRRVLGNVIREGQLISLIWSVTETNDAERRAYDFVYQAMVNFVGRDYPTATKTHLESVVSLNADTPAKTLAVRILAAMKEHQDALDALPMIEELLPLTEHRHRFTKERRRQMNDAFDEANKNSLWRQIATRIPLKAGRSSFSMRGGEVGEKMHLSSISHAVAIPRSEAIDRIGSDLMRLQFNLEKEGVEE